MSPSPSFTPISALTDGGNNVGHVAVYLGAEIAIAKAKESGVAAVGVYNSYFSGRNAYYLERIVNAGLVGLRTASGSPHIIPPGGTRPALGTNPIAFGFPSVDGPVIFDIGTASLIWGEVLLAAETGEALPAGLAFDADGNPTQDGRAAAKGGVAAFGGHKGYRLAFAIQTLASSPVPRSRAAGCRITGVCSWLSTPARLCSGTRSRSRCRNWWRQSRRRHGGRGSTKSASRRSAPSANASAAELKASSSMVP